MSFQEPVKVLVVDDHVGIRAGIADLINAQPLRMCCVGTAGTGREAISRTRELQPHVIVLDVDLDGEDGLSLIPALRRDAHCAVVVFTGLADPQVTVRALRQGAHTCLNKTVAAADLMNAIVAARSAGEEPARATPPDAGRSFLPSARDDPPISDGRTC